MRIKCCFTKCNYWLVHLHSLSFPQDQTVGKKIFNKNLEKSLELSLWFLFCPNMAILVCLLGQGLSGARGWAQAHRSACLTCPALAHVAMPSCQPGSEWCPAVFTAYLYCWCGEEMPPWTLGASLRLLWQTSSRTLSAEGPGVGWGWGGCLALRKHLNSCLTLDKSQALAPISWIWTSAPQLSSSVALNLSLNLSGLVVYEVATSSDWKGHRRLA